MKNIILLISILVMGHTYAQEFSHPFPSKGKVNIILDTDMGNDIDDALALDMLFKYSDQKRVKILALMNNKASATATFFLDLMATWYGYPKTPIGKIVDGVTINDYVDYSKNMVDFNAEHKYYSYSVKKPEDMLEAHLLYRKILAQQPDHSVVVVSIGFLTNLSRLLQTKPDQYSSLNGRELVAKKVQYLAVMAGSFGAKKRAEFNIIHDIPAAQYTLEQWPVGLVLAPFEIGAKVIYPSSSISDDFNWTNHHPLVDAYKRYRPFPYNRATWDLMAVYYAVEQESNLLERSQAGLLTVDNKGFTHFVEQPAGQHYVLSIADSNTQQLKNYFVDLIKAKPKKYTKIAKTN